VGAAAPRSAVAAEAAIAATAAGTVSSLQGLRRSSNQAATAQLLERFL
jgi:hypothetical protein